MRCCTAAVGPSRGRFLLARGRAPWPSSRVTRARIALISTGGTIEKSYDELEGVLVNDVSNLDMILAGLSLNGVHLTRVPLMNKDSREMGEADHTLIAKTAEVLGEQHDGVVIVHGTDRLTQTGDRIVELLGTPRVPIVLTGAMRPFLLRTTDAAQNITEALLSVQIASPGVYVAMHNRLLRFPGVAKDFSKGTFVLKEEIKEPRNPFSIPGVGPGNATVDDRPGEGYGEGDASN